MSDYVSLLYNYFSKLFVRRKNPPLPLKTEVPPPSRYCTPLRAPSRMNMTSFKNLASRRQSSYPDGLMRVPPILPPTRSSSQVSLMKFGAEDVPLGQERFSRNRRFEDPFRSPLKCCQVSSKIPVRIHGRCRPSVAEIQFQRGLHTLTSKSNRSHESEDTIDGAFRASDLGNCVGYRFATNAKFESTFRSISKKRHAIGNLMDSTSHMRWMQLAGIDADKDAKMFKLYAGGRVVLNLGEYKSLLNKMCSIHDLDYWDVLRRMATFQAY